MNRLIPPTMLPLSRKDPRGFARFAPAILFSVIAAAATAFAQSDSPEPKAGLHVTAPLERIVFQRDLENHAKIPVQGDCPVTATKVEAHLVALDDHKVPAGWTLIDNAPAGGHFKGQLPANGGWYKLEVRATDAKGAVITGAVEHVGVGEVFVIAGHSVAHGGDINIEGSADDRVNAVQSPEKTTEEFRKYEASGAPKDLPPPIFIPYVEDVRPAPVGRGTYCWAKFGEAIAKKYDVPVLIYNASFGGSSLEHWAKSATGVQFEHPFIKSKIGMPHTNVYNTLKYYIPLTGMRAILSDQGQNDWPNENEAQVFGYYKTWLDRVRKDVNFNLTVVVNRQTPPGDKKAIRHVQEQVIREYPSAYPGPDYDTFATEDRVDGIHLSASGEVKAAQMWADAIDENFIKTAKPYIPPLRQPPLVK